MVAAVIGQGIAAAGHDVATEDIIDAIKATGTQWKGSGHSICTGWGEIDGQTTPQAIMKKPPEKPANKKPKARFNISPQSGVAPFTATIDASPSSDPDGSIQRYAWLFDSDRGPRRGKILTERFDEGDIGTVTVTLNVLGSGGKADVTRKQITIKKPQNEPPEARASYSTR
jgi:PKD repeat protein